MAGDSPERSDPEKGEQLNKRAAPPPRCGKPAVCYEVGVLGPYFLTLGPIFLTKILI